MTLAVGGKVIAPPSLTNLINHCRYALTHIYPYFQNQTDVCLVPEIWDTVFYGCCWYLLLPHCVNVLLKPFYNQTNLPSTLQTLSCLSGTSQCVVGPSAYPRAFITNGWVWQGHCGVWQQRSERVKFVGTTGALVVLSVWRVWSILSHPSIRSNSKVS